MRLKAVTAACCVILATATANAQQSSFVGTWQTTIYGMTDTLMIGPNGQYTETAMGPGGLTQETGFYTLMGQNIISFRPVDWNPKTKSVYHGTGSVGGYVTQEPVAPPPGNTCEYQFNGPGLLMMQCQNVPGVTITYQRR